MKLRNKLIKFKHKHRIYSWWDLWKKYDILISMIAFWVLVLTLLALEEKGLI